MRIAALDGLADPVDKLFIVSPAGRGHRHLKDQFGMALSENSPKIVHGKVRIYIFQNAFHIPFNLVKPIVAGYNRIDMDDHVDIHPGAEVLFDVVNEMMDIKDIAVCRHLGVHRRKAPVRPVVVYDKVMEPYYAFITFQLILYLF